MLTKYLYFAVHVDKIIKNYKGPAYEDTAWRA